MATYGIDLGTTYSAIATLNEEGKPVVIENQIEAKQILASAVYFPTDESAKPVVGEEAKNMREVEGDRVFECVKRKIGKDNSPLISFGGVEYNPITISSLILKRLAEYSGEQGHEVKDVVITCPAYFGLEERNATRQAGEIAGFNVLAIINEPTAAALNYCVREVGENRTIMVFDLGGGTFDITIMKMEVGSGGANIEIVATDGNDLLGGRDWDDRLFQHLLSAYCNETGGDAASADTELRQVVRSKVEDLKKQLSNAESKKTTINYGGDSVKIEVSRAEFDSMTSDLLAQTMGFVDSIFAKSGLSEDKIDVVLLVGGSTRMPQIFDAVSARFPGQGKVRREDPDLAVAKGAAVYSTIVLSEKQKEEGLKPGEEAAPTIALPSGIKKVQVIDKTARSFGPGILNGPNRDYRIDNLILIGQGIPAENSATYGTVEDNQPNVLLRVFENVEGNPANRFVVPCTDMDGNPQTTDPNLKVKQLGELTLDLPPNTPANSPIEVTFKVDAGGVYVKALFPQNGAFVEATLQSDNTLAREEVEQAKKKLSMLQTTGEA